MVPFKLISLRPSLVMRFQVSRSTFLQITRVVSQPHYRGAQKTKKQTNKINGGSLQ